MSEKVKKNINIFLILLVFLFIAVWSSLTPAWSDDFHNIINGKGITISQILQIQHQRYFIWSGRVVAESIASMLVSIGRIPFGILNGLVFAAMSVLVFKLASTDKFRSEKGNYKYLFILLELFWLMPSFGQVVLWTSGSGNYLWTATLNLLFIYYFIYMIDDNNKALYILMIPVSILSGACNENTGIGVLVFLVLHSVLNKERILNLKNRIPLMLTYLVGYIFLLAAPGNSVRAQTHDAAFMQLSFANRIATRFMGLSDIITAKLLIPLILLMIFVALRLAKTDYQYVVRNVIPYFVGAAIMVYALVMSPELDANAGRMYLLPFLFVLIATVNCLQFDTKDQLNQFIVVSVFMCMILETFLSVSNGFIDSMKTNIAIQHRWDSIIAQKKDYNKKTGIVVPQYSYTGTTKYSVSKETNFDMVPWPTGSYNILLSKAFGVSKISIK